MSIPFFSLIDEQNRSKADIKTLKECLKIAEDKLMRFEVEKLNYTFATRNLDKLRFPIWRRHGLVWTAADRLTRYDDVK